jgi:transcriptional antiterminator RfaH
MEVERKTAGTVKNEPTTKVKNEPNTIVKNNPTTKVKNEPTSSLKPTPSPLEVKWYAIYTNPRAEKRVAERLEEKGIHVYLPLQKKLRQWSDRKKWVETPLFSSYIFVKIDRRDYDRVLQTNGVVKYITFEGRAVAIPQNQIDNLRIVVDSNADVETTWETRRKGEKVRVNGGPLKGLEGVLISDGGRKKVLVQVDRLDQNLVVEVPLGLIDKIG